MPDSAQVKPPLHLDISCWSTHPLPAQDQTRTPTPRNTLCQARSWDLPGTPVRSSEKWLQMCHSLPDFKTLNHEKLLWESSDNPPCCWSSLCWNIMLIHGFMKKRESVAGIKHEESLWTLPTETFLSEAQKGSETQLKLRSEVSGCCQSGAASDPLLSCGLDFLGTEVNQQSGLSSFLWPFEPWRRSPARWCRAEIMLTRSVTHFLLWPRL